MLGIILTPKVNKNEEDLESDREEETEIQRRRKTVRSPSFQKYAQVFQAVRWRESH